MPSDFNKPDQLSLQGNAAKNWKVWKQKFDIYMLAKEALECYN
jgi:hypothetical protein